MFRVRKGRTEGMSRWRNRGVRGRSRRLRECRLLAMSWRRGVGMVPQCRLWSNGGLGRGQISDQKYQKHISTQIHT